jgi:predicted PurR-regulated permease PerM
MGKDPFSKFFFLILIGFLILICWLFRAYFSSIILALLIASAFYPAYLKLKGAFKVRDQLAAVTMTGIIFLILVVPVAWFTVTLGNEAYNFYSKTMDGVSFQEIEQKIQGNSPLAVWVRRAAGIANIDVTPEGFRNLAATLGKHVGLTLSKQITAMASNLVNFLINFCLMILSIYYIFLSGNALKEYITGTIPLPLEQQELVMKKFKEMANAVINGNVLSGVIQGVLGGLGFFFFGLDAPFLWGSVIGFFAFLPILGSPAVYIPATLILLLKGNTGLAIGFLIYSLCYNSVVEFLVKPKFISKGMSMNPVLVFMGILGGMKVFGILGVIYGPLILTIFFTLLEIYRLEYCNGGPDDTDIPNSKNLLK